MLEYDLLGHVFYFLLAVGMYLLAGKNGCGWLFRLVGELGWVYIGVVTGMTSIWMWGLAFVILDLKGYASWKE
jgi:hypothetical protein